MISTKLFYVACFLGFLFQSDDIINLYLKYEAITQVSVRHKEFLRPVDVSFCSGLEAILSPPLFFDLFSSATIKEYFDFTPNPESLLTCCMIREPNQYGFVLIRTQQECNHFFTIRKFYVKEYICYDIRLSIYENETYNYDNIANAEFFSNSMFALYLNETFMKSSKLIKVGIGPNSLSGYHEKSFAFAEYMKINRKAVDPVSLSANYYTYTTINLPAPYFTDCMNYFEIGFPSKQRCISQCITKGTIEAFNKVPFTESIYEPIALHHIHMTDTSNRTFNLILNSLEMKFKSSCRNWDCLSKKYINSLSAEYNDVNRLLVKATREPSLVVQFQAKLKIAEFIIYLLSTFSTWFGFSVLS